MCPMERPNNKGTGSVAEQQRAQRTRYMTALAWGSVAPTAAYLIVWIVERGDRVGRMDVSIYVGSMALILHGMVVLAVIGQARRLRTILACVGFACMMGCGLIGTSALVEFVSSRPHMGVRRWDVLRWAVIIAMIFVMHAALGTLVWTARRWRAAKLMEEHGPQTTGRYDAGVSDK